MSAVKTRRRRKKKQKKEPLTLRSFIYTEKSDYFDYNLLAVILILTCFGLIMLYSTSSYMAEVNYGDDMHYFKRQAVISSVCILGALVISKMDYHILERFVAPIYFLALILMILVITPLGSSANGARRWLGRGSFRFQPAEIAKIAVIVALAYLIGKIGKSIKRFRGVAFLIIIGGIQAFVAYKFTDNLSTAIIIFGIVMGMIFIAHPRYRGFMIIAGVGIVVLVIFLRVAYSMLDTLVISEDMNFRIRRIFVWLSPESFASGFGYQTLQALYAIGSGGLFGRGLGNSIQKLGSVPEAQNDFIFSIICEELGIVGGVMVLLIFSYLLYRLFFIAQNAPDLFGALLVSGIFIHIALQVLLNVAVVLNVLPNTGVTLPFISYGGTSVMFLMAEMGIAMSVSRQIRFQETPKLL